MTNTESRDEQRNPLEKKWLRRRDARFEIDYLRQQSDEIILAKARATRGFKFLEDLYGFRIDRTHPDTLQITFGNRSMFRHTADLKKTAVETGPTLLYSLGPTGEFSTVLYPTKSDLARTFEDHLFLQIGATSGVKLVEGIGRDLKMLVAYAHVSSIDMTPTFEERFRIGLLRLFASRAENGEFKNSAWWSGFVRLAKFGGRTFATASFLSMLKPLGFALLLILLLYFGWDGLADHVRSLAGSH